MLNSGDTLSILAGRDINLLGSTVSLEQGTAALTAAGDVNIAAATETHIFGMWATRSHSNVGRGDDQRRQ